MTETPDTRTDDVLLHAMAQQDTTALAELYRRYAGQSLALAQRHGLSEPVQRVEDAFVVLFRSAHGFDRSSLPAAVWTLVVMQRHYWTLSSSVIPPT